MANNLPKYTGSLQKKKDMSGVYRARVESNADPYNLGRVRVRVPMLHGSDTKSNTYISNDCLPWATPCFMSAGADYGSYIVPEVGEFVMVSFEGGDIESPVYMGSCYGVGAKSKDFGKEEEKGGYGKYSSVDGQCETPDDVKKDNSKKIIYRSIKGASFEIDDSNGGEAISMIDPLGQSVTLSSSLSSSALKNKYRRHSRSCKDGGDIQDNTNGAKVSISGAFGQNVTMSSEKDGVSKTVIENGDVSLKFEAGGGKTKEKGKMKYKNGDIEVRTSSEDKTMTITNGKVDITINDEQYIITKGDATVIMTDGYTKMVKGSTSVTANGTNIVLVGAEILII